MRSKLILSCIILGSISVASVAIIVPTVIILENNKKEENQKPENSEDNSPYDVDETYLKNNKVKAYNDGRFSFSRAGKGGQDSVKLSLGPLKTEPSPGIESKVPVQSSYLYNQTDIDMAKRTFSLIFSDGNQATHLGTGWILDFKLPNQNQSYPTTWYFATNAHVIQNLKVKNDVISPERWSKFDDDRNTSKLTLVTANNFELNKNLNPVGQSPASWDKVKPHESFKSYELIYDENKSNMKTVFIGTDYLTTSPKMYSKDDKWQKYEECADFAVMEITFDSEQAAQSMTNNYYNNKNNQFKYKKESILKNQNNLVNNNFTTLGFPAEENIPPSWKPYNRSSLLASNKKQNPSEELKNNGGTLGTSNYYQSFEGLKSCFDASLTLNYLGLDYRYANNDPDGITNPTKTQYFNSWGLMYPVDYGNLGGGSSGSMLMDRNGYTWGIHLGGDANASTGITQALYCEGFNYQGSFGRYNLQGYDLIEGGFPNQKKSYRDGLIQLYKDNKTPYKTNLFPNGVIRK